MYKITSVFLFTLFVFALSAQTDSLLIVENAVIEVDSLQNDSLVLQTGAKKGFRNWLRKDDYPNPKKALFYSLVLPGSGQLYNKKYWKVPIFYGGMGFLVYRQVVNVRQYRTFKRNYAASVDMDPATVVDAQYMGVTSGQLKNVRDKAQQLSELSGLGIGLLYIFATADAYVDAHLASFDVSDDLSLNIEPSFEGNSIGVGLVFSLR